MQASADSLPLFNKLVCLMFPFSTFIHEFSYAFLLAKSSDQREGPFIWAKHLIALLEKLHFARTLSSIITR
jgi:hypothetical protein